MTTTQGGGEVQTRFRPSAHHLHAPTMHTLTLFDAQEEPQLSATPTKMHITEQSVNSPDYLEGKDSL